MRRDRLNWKATYEVDIFRPKQLLPTEWFAAPAVAGAAAGGTAAAAGTAAATTAAAAGATAAGTAAATGITAAQVMTAMQIAGTAMTALSMMSKGGEEYGAAKYDAAQLEAGAKAEEAKSQRVAAAERRKARILQSNALAAAVAGGSTATDVGVLDITSDIAQEGEYNAALALWEGSERAAGKRTQAGVRKWEGKQKKKASKRKAFGSVLSAAPGIYSSGKKAGMWGKG